MTQTLMSLLWRNLITVFEFGDLYYVQFLFHVLFASRQPRIRNSLRIHRLLSVWEGERIKSQREAKEEKRQQVKGVCPQIVKSQDVDDLACPLSKPTLKTVSLQQGAQKCSGLQGNTLSHPRRLRNRNLQGKRVFINILFECM